MHVFVENTRIPGFFVNNYIPSYAERSGKIKIVTNCCVYNEMAYHVWVQLTRMRSIDRTSPFRVNLYPTSYFFTRIGLRSFLPVLVIPRGIPIRSKEVGIAPSLATNAITSERK